VNDLKASIIIAFYNKVNFLDLVLAGLSRQTETNFEVLIADDGSSQANVELAKSLYTKCPFKISHLWHEDKGFRKNIMLNKCILKAAAPIIIIIDGDCIPHSKFVEEHLASTKQGVCSTGRRVNLSPAISNSLTFENVKAGFLECSHFKMIWHHLIGQGGNHAGQGIYIKNKWLRKKINTKQRGVLGSNFSVSKDDIYAINGFDERYCHPAVGEDTDVEYRLRLNGVKVASLIHVANQYHLYHKELPRNPVNDSIFAQTKKLNQAFTPYGIKQN
jgi:glycosyltransferase involved in cell wall biosynthesis